MTGSSAPGGAAAALAARIDASRAAIAREWLARTPAPAAEGSASAEDLVAAVSAVLAGAGGAAPAVQAWAGQRSAGGASPAVIVGDCRALGVVLEEFAGDAATAPLVRQAVLETAIAAIEAVAARHAAADEARAARLEGVRRIVDHDMSQPLSAIQFAAEVLRSGTAGPAALLRMSEIIERSVDDLVTKVAELNRLATARDRGA